MNHKNLLLALATIFALNVSECVYAKEETKESVTELRLDMRKLWEDHIQWTRNFIISAIANLEDENAVTERLLDNQEDIGNIFKPFFGDKFAHRLTKLLKQHIIQAAAVTADAIAGNTAQFKIDYAAWQKNAREIAKFLSENNPHWSREEIQEMMYKHLKLTTGEVSSRLKQDWEADIKFYDKNHVHMLMFSDVLTFGVKKEFPNKFK